MATKMARLLVPAFVSCLTASGQSLPLTAETMPAALKNFYNEAVAPTVYTLERANAGFWENWNTHSNLYAPGKVGPGTTGWVQQLTGFKGHIPNLKWNVHEVIHLEQTNVGDMYLVVGSGGGTPQQSPGAWLPVTGKSFEMMSIDMHWVEGGKIKETWHTEDWIEAMWQLGNPNGTAVLHRGISLNAGGGSAGQQRGIGMKLNVTDGYCDEMAACLKGYYYSGLTATPNLTMEQAQSWVDENFAMHPNLLNRDVAGPGKANIYNFVQGFFAPVPDMDFKSERVYKVPCVEGDKYIHVGTVTGTPKQAFLGVPYSGRSFHQFGIDIHYVVNGVMKETWTDVEWLGAVGQLSAGPIGPRHLHDGQPLNLDTQRPETTCANIKQAYQTSGCCGSPAKVFQMPGQRRLTASVEAALESKIERELKELTSSGGNTQAAQLAENIQNVIAPFLQK